MDREKEIEEMRKIANDCDDHCGSPCTEYCIECIIKKFYDNGYRKIPDGAVVLTKEEYDEIKNALEVSKAYMVKEAYRTEQTRKETAREILKKANEIAYPEAYDRVQVIDLQFFKNWLKENFGVEVEG